MTRTSSMSEVGVWRIAAVDPDRAAVISPDGQTESFRQLAERSNQVAQGLRVSGLETGNIVALLMRNSTALVEVVLGAMQVGMYVVPINYHSTAEDIAYILENSGAKALFFDGEFADTCTEAMKCNSFPIERAVCTSGASGYHSYETWKSEYPTHRPAESKAGSVMYYTSGTTGRPKGVLRPLSGLNADAGAEQQTWILSVFGIEPGPGRHLVNSPLYHTAVLNLALAALHAGQTLIQMDQWDAERALALIERHRVTTTHMVAPHFHRFLALDESVRTRYDTASLEYVLHGAVPTPVDIKKRMLDWWGPVIYEYYGSSEVGGTIATPEHWLAKPGTVGRPFEITEIKIVDDDGHPVATGDAGWIYMKQGSDTFSYHKDPGKTEKASMNEFICVGDIGYLDEDGDLFLCGRDAEIIISGGVNIYPAAVEAKLLNHDAVADVAVVGVPDEEYGESVKAVVQLKPGASASEQELIDYCRDNLSHIICPKSVDFVEDLPRDPTGKLYKHRVRAKYWQDHERAI